VSKRDYYEVLGVDRNVDVKELKKAYRRVAMKCHPDRAPGDKDSEDKFKEASEAYEVLSDPEKRAAYDRFGHEGVNSQGMGGGGFQSGGFEDIFGDVFGDIFGGGRRRPRRGSDLQYTMELSLEEAVSGTETSIRIPTLVACETCEGSGAKPGTSKKACGTCHGQGRVGMRTPLGTIEQSCPHCHGQGQVISEPCTTCRGQGRVQEYKTLSVKVPSGVDTGDRIRLSGEGEAGPEGAPPGDLYVQVLVREHKLFKRDGADLFCEIPISFIDTALGGEIEVPTLNGKVKLRVPAETQTGKLFRMRGKGVKPVRGGVVGDLLCRVIVETPVRLSDKQKALLEEFRDTLEEKHSPKSKSWLDGVKTFFDSLTS